MLRTTKSGHADDALCCPACGNVNMWQPEDHSPCEDDWWCPGCRGWTCCPDTLNDTAYKMTVLVKDRVVIDTTGRHIVASEVRSACA